MDADCLRREKPTVGDGMEMGNLALHCLIHNLGHQPLLPATLFSPRLIQDAELQLVARLIVGAETILVNLVMGPLPPVPLPLP